VPILATLVMERPSPAAAYASVATGIAALFVVSWLTGGKGYGWASPVFIASLVSGAGFAVASLGNAGRARGI